MRAVFIAIFFSLLCGRAGAHFTEPRLLGEDARTFTQATKPGEARGFKDERFGLTAETHTKVLWAGWLPVMEERTRTVSGVTTRLPRRWFQWGADLSGTLDGAGGIGGLVGIIEEDGAGGVTRTLLPVQDGLGNITAVIDQATGRTVARYDYGPFGEPLSESGEVDACPFRWQTKWYDAESQHYYFGYRHYDPRFGRWLSRDPLGEAGGFNLYAYCGNDPVNRHDPLGLSYFVWDIDGNGRLVEDELCIICHGVSARGMVGPPNMMRLNGKTWYSNPYDYPAGVAGGVVAAPQRLFSLAEEVINIVGGKYGTSGFFGLEWEVDFNLYDADSYERKAARFVSPNAQFDSSSYKLGVFTGDLAANGVITLGAGEAFTFAKAGFGTLRLMSFGGEEIIGQGMVGGLNGFRGGPGARWVGELLPGRAGSFLELDSLRVTGDNLTPHHMPQAALKLTGYNKGGAIMMPQDLHVLTRTYGTGGRILARQEAGVAFRDVLFLDIRDVRSIVGSEYNSGLKDLLQYYRETFPGLMTKTPK